MKKHIQKLIVACLVGVQVLALPTMAQEVIAQESIAITEMTGIKPGLRQQALKGTITSNQELNMQAGDSFVLGFYHTDNTKVNEAMVLEELPNFKIVCKGEALVADKDFTMTLQEGQVVITLKRAVEGNVEMTIEHLVVKSEMNLDRYYNLILEAHQGDVKEKLSMQRVPIDYGYLGTLGGRIAFTTESKNCEVEGTVYILKGAPYQDTQTGQMMIPLKDTLVALGTIQKNMHYSKGTFEALVPLKHTFKVGETLVLDEKENFTLTQPVVMKDGMLYIGIEDFAKMFNGEVIKGEENSNEVLLHIPVNAWLEIRK